MASDAHAMLRSRDFGSSGSSEEEDNNDHHAGEYQEQQRHDGDYEHVQHQYDHDSINNTTDPTTAGASASVSGAGARTASRQHYHSSDSSTSGYDVSNAQSTSYIGHQTAANLASFEDSFIPPQQHQGDDEDDDVDEGLYSPGGSNRRQGQAGIGGPRPKTPSAKELQSTRQQQRRVVSDAAGFTRHQGPRDIFDNRDDGGGLADISQYEDRNARNQQQQQGRQRRTASRQQQRHGDTDSNAQEEVEDDGDGTSGLNDQPSFERSESQSMRVETVNTKRGGGSAKNGAVTGSSRDADSSRHVKAGSKQQLTLREQEKLIDEVNKENFSLKLKIYFLEERLAKLTPEQMDVALKETIELKVEYQSLKQELKKHKKWLLEATNALEESRKNQDMAHGRVSRTEQEANAEISRLRAELEAEKQARVEEREDLEAQLDDALARANEREEEGEELHKNIDGLEEENAKLRSQVNAQVTMLATRNDEKEQLYDELEALKQDNLALETELQEQRDRRASNASGRETSIAELEDDLNKYRDKLSAAMLDLERREKDIAELNAELDQREAEHEEDVAKAIDEWKIALEEARQDKDQLTDALEDRERELEKMDKKLEEFDNLAREDQKKVDKALRKADEKQKEVDALGEEVMGLTDDIQKLSKQIEALEDEADDKTARIQDLEKDLDAADRELEDRQRMHEQVVIALKEKAASNKSRQADLTIQHESLTTEVTFLRNKTEELALKCAELEESKRSDDKLRQRLQDDKYALEKRLRDKEAELQEVELHHNRQISEMESDWRTTISEKDQSLNSVRSQLRQVQDRLQVREQDLERLNEVLQNRDEQAKRQGDDHTSDRMSLILEVERLNRDLAHYEADLDHARAELDRKEDELRQRDLEAATLRATNNDISAQLALQTQSRLNLSDQLDATSKTLRQTQDDVANLRDRLHRAEKDQSGNSRSTGRANADYRDQLSERNSLLQGVYQAIDKAVGMDKKRPSQADLKPHTNFAVFYDAIMSRIRVIVQVQQLFERKAKDIEGRFVDQINSLKKQQDSRMRQLDRLELAVKNAVDSQKQWKQRILLKHNEVESVKATNGELNEQLSSLKTRVNVTDMSPGSNKKIQALAARASTAERRLKATQDQLQTVETKFAEAKNKVATAEDHWQARLKELMNKLREAEEKNKRERQGAKERVRELQQNISDLQAQIDNANSRNRKLAHVLDNQVM